MKTPHKNYQKILQKIQGIISALTENSNLLSVSKNYKTFIIHLEKTNYIVVHKI